MERTVHLPPLKYTFHEENILEAQYDEGNLTISIGLAEEIVTKRLKLQAGKPYRILIHASTHLNVTPAARDYFVGSMGLKGISAIAILLNGWTVFTILRFVILFKRSGPPIAVFRDRRAAKDWLLKQELDNFSEHPSAPSHINHSGDQLILRALDEWGYFFSTTGGNSSDKKAGTDAVDEVKTAIEKAISLGQSSADRRKLEAALRVLARPNNIPPLTRPESQLALQMAQGLTTKEIAEKLAKSPRTIDTQKRELYKKFKVFNGTELIVKLNQFGLLGLE
jgi:DNA-binding CsgD family transcriptional regulator